MGETKGRRILERPRCRWRLIYKWIFEKRGGGYGLDCSGSGQGEVAVMNLWFPSNAGNLLTG
jgi:hypothetical protein